MRSRSSTRMIGLDTVRRFWYKLMQVATNNKCFADRHRSETLLFQPGDRIWLSTWDIQNTTGCKKLITWYTGPFKILRCINPVTYKLELPCHCRLANSFHVSQLRAVKPGPLDTESPPIMPPAPLEIDGQPAYLVK